jgi:hypothetical protein
MYALHVALIQTESAPNSGKPVYSDENGEPLYDVVPRNVQNE